MADSVKALDIIVSAKDQATAVLSKISASVQKNIAGIGKGIGIGSAPSGEDNLDAAGKVFRVAAAVNAARAASEATRATVQALRGDWDAVQASLDKLPLGVGALNRSIRETVYEITGLNNAINAAKASASRDDLFAGWSKSAREQVGQAIGAMKEIGIKARREAELAGKEGFALAEAQIVQDAAAASDQIDKLREDSIAKARADAKAAIDKAKADLAALGPAESVIAGVGGKTLNYVNPEIKRQQDELNAKIRNTTVELEQFEKRLRESAEGYRKDVAAGAEAKLAAASKEADDRIAKSIADELDNLFGGDSNVRSSLDADVKAKVDEERRRIEASIPRFVDPNVSGAESRFGSGLAQAAKEQAQARTSKEQAMLKAQLDGNAILNKVLNAVIENGRGAVVLADANL